MGKQQSFASQTKPARRKHKRGEGGEGSVVTVSLIIGEKNTKDKTGVVPRSFLSTALQDATGGWALSGGEQDHGKQHAIDREQRPMLTPRTIKRRRVSSRSGQEIWSRTRGSPHLYRVSTCLPQQCCASA